MSKIQDFIDNLEEQVDYMTEYQDEQQGEEKATADLDERREIRTEWQAVEDSYEKVKEGIEILEKLYNAKSN